MEAVELTDAVHTVLARAEAGATVTADWVLAAFPRLGNRVLETLEVLDLLDDRAGVPHRVGPYTVGEVLGRGGMSTVYAAERDREPVALKVLHAGQDTARLLREAELGKQLRHENLVATLDAGTFEIDGKVRPFVVLERVDGTTLAEIVDATGPLPEPYVRQIAVAVAAALDCIHAAGAIHHDVKPANILLASDGRVLLTDLGVSSLAADHGPRGFAGSLPYAAPERLTGRDVDGRADLYALGITLAELLSGEAPSAATPVPPFAEHASPFFARVVQALLASARYDRPASAQLCRILAEGEASAWWRGHARGRGVAHPMVGRRRELAALCGPGVKLVVGAAGSGKSLLISHFVAGVAGNPHLLVGTHRPGSLASGMDALCEAVGALDNLGKRLRSGLGDLAPWADAIAARLTGDTTDPSLPAAVLRASLIRFVRRLAQQAPTIVILEDLHYASAGGSELFRALARALPDDATLIGTTRPGADVLSSIELSAHVPLEPLSQNEIGTVLEHELAPDRPLPDLVACTAEHAGGNPYLAISLLRAWREGGEVGRASAGAWGMRNERPTVPRDVRSVFTDRLGALTRTERELVSVAACVGSRFDPGLVADAAGFVVEEGLVTLALLLRRGVVRNMGGEMAFDHDLLFEVARERSEPCIHAAVADAIERRTPDPDAETTSRLCLHRIHAGDVQRADELLDEAISYRLGRADPEATIAFLNVALELDGLLIEERRCRVLLELATQLAFRGRPGVDEALTAASAIADEIGHGRLRAEARWRLCDYYATTERVGDACAVGRDAIRIAKTTDAQVDHARAWSAMQFALYRTGQAQEALRAGENAVRVATGAGDTGVLGVATARLGAALITTDLERAGDLLERAAELAAEADGWREEMYAVGHLGIVRTQQGRVEDARHSLRRSLELARRYGDHRTATILLGRIGELNTHLGDLGARLACHERQTALLLEMDERMEAARAFTWLGVTYTQLGAWAPARASFERATTFRDVAGPGEWAVQLWHAGALEREAGRPREAERLLREALSLFPQVDDEISRAGALNELGRLYLDTDPSRARDAFVEAREVATASGARSAELIATSQLRKVGDLASASPDIASLEALDHFSCMEIRFALWQAGGDERHLSAAGTALHHALALVPPQYRTSFVRNVSLHRAIETATPPRSAAGRSRGAPDEHGV